MAIQRWDPMRDLMVLHERVHRLFEESIARSGGLASVDPLPASAWVPPVDLHEEPGRFLLRADIPGVAASALVLEVNGSEMVIRGERTPDPNVPRDAFLRKERPGGSFVLRLTVPESVERTAIQASQRDGVLEVTLPKKKESPEASRVVVPVK